MRIRLGQLVVTCRRSVERVVLADFTYFHGEIGSGKSTIARLIDFVFGGGLVETKAIQSEFVAATLDLMLNDIPLSLTRERGANQVSVVWGAEGSEQQVVVSARHASGVVIPDTEVENLSDFLFYIAGFRPPRVRRSRIKEDSELERLSFRDLFWYCYLDQDEIDSNFFHLDAEADTFKRLKSRNVLRFVLGYHQERVAELEAELEHERAERLRLESGATVLAETLTSADIATEADLEIKITRLRQEVDRLKRAIREARQAAQQQRDHAVDGLRTRGMQLAEELDAIERASATVESTLAEDRRHLHEIENLATKIQRAAAARSVLNGVEFELCPRCTQPLPPRAREVCRVCDQLEPTYEQSEDAIALTRADIAARSSELEEVIEQETQQRASLSRRRNELVAAKQRVDLELNRAMSAYDSAYLSQALALERGLAEATQNQAYLEKLQALPRRVKALQVEAERRRTRERELREELRIAREAAEKDTSNIRLLGSLFLDCLLRAKLPTFSDRDHVSIQPPGFLPEVIGPESGDLATVSFATLGSGGLKTIFKCCFALAIHRLAVQTGAVLPTLLIIDSPMKNISERENRTQFEGFHQMLYELAQGELSETQLVLIDKEFCAPSDAFEREMTVRHMTVSDADAPPLITYYRDHPTDGYAGESPNSGTTDT